MCDKGADIVICQHSHCIGCEENYKSSKIVYGQGNFLLDMTDLESWKTGLLLGLQIDQNGLNVQYYPIVKYRNTVRLALKDESELIIRAFYERSEKIKEKGFIEKVFADYCLNCESKYLMVMFGLAGLLKRIINRTTKGYFLKKWYGRKARMMILDYMICESHQEVLRRIMAAD
jgi:poly-gamma-glutamate synthesis protein (capsule biosynthesis protein)